MQSALTCFIIENDEEDQEIFSMALNEVTTSASCIFADNGVKALEKLKADPSFIPSCIFLDMNMPLMDGPVCLVEIKKIERLKNVPVFIYSTAADPVAITKVKEMGATAFIVKPASFKELVKLLSGILKDLKPHDEQ